MLPVCKKISLPYGPVRIEEHSGSVGSLYYSAHVDGFGVLGLQAGPLNKEVVGQVVEDLSGEREGLHAADALHVDQHHPLQSQNA